MTQIDNRTQEQVTTPANRPPRLRFAPSPTGFQHIGGFRTALFSWLYARHGGGQFILRIEDTDTTRTVEGSVEDILQGFKWLGMDIDEGPTIGGPYGPYSQLQRKSIYQYYAHKLIESGHAYKCYCTPERLDQMRKEREAKKLPPRYDRRCRYLSAEERAANEAAGLKYTVRLSMPLEGKTVVHDELHGDMVFENSNLDDIIILKSNGLAPYHLAAIVDDHLMNITHVLRGEDWISTSPYHITIYRALGWEPPRIYHVSNVLGKDKKKLSKRRNAPSWSDFKRQGYLPEAVFNFMALMGWSYDDKTEFFTKEELIRVFTLDRISVASGLYDPDKLLWMNGVYIRKLSLDELVDRTIPYMERPEAEGGLPDSVARPLDREYTKRVLELEQERMKTLSDAAEKTSFFYLKEIDYDASMLIQKKMDAESTRNALQHAYTLLSGLENWDHEIMEQPMRDLAQQLELKPGQLFGAVRVAVSASNATPPLFQMLEVLGREVSLKRIQDAINKLA
uniref:Glutamate--tRNA ligase n=1 Tax=Thermosporothrix sp. COM3 TaxID=2490863 RepID=A0A455SJC4_9CHLR|nr:glutamate--tRNA ligase [Thermosporothrix sp. COM3]